MSKLRHNLIILEGEKMVWGIVCGVDCGGGGRDGWGWKGGFGGEGFEKWISRQSLLAIGCISS